MANPTISFGESRAKAFNESIAHARHAGGIGGTQSISRLSAVGCATWRHGIKDFFSSAIWSDLTDGTASSIYYLVQSGWIEDCPSDSTCHLSTSYVVTSTPDPATLSGTSVTSLSEAVGQGGSFTNGTQSSSSGSGTHWVGDQYSSSGPPDSYSSTANSVTWTFTGTYLDAENVEQEWTQTCVVTVSGEYTYAEFKADAAALWSNVSKSDGYIWLYDADGDPYLSDNGVPFTGWVANTLILTDDIPTTSSCAGVYWGFTGSDYIFPGYQTDACIAIAAVQFRITTHQTPALFKRTSDSADARTNAESWLLPAGSYDIWIEPSDDDISNIEDDIGCRYGVAAAAAYTNPTPDYPEPA